MRDPRHTARWRKTAELAYQRDLEAGAPCHICGDAIDYYAKPGTAYAYEADHWPVSVKQMMAMGQPDLAFDLNGIKASHCSCNRSDGSINGTYEIGSPTRAL